jgi:autotransporter-associated beta strand protein
VLAASLSGDANYTLQANHDVIFNATVAFGSAAGKTVSITATNNIFSTGFAVSTAGGALTLNSATMALGGIDTGAGLLTINNSGAAAQAAAFVGSGGLSKLGAGTLTLSQANTYTGTTTVSGGILNLSGSLANTGSLVVSGGTLDLQTNNQQFAGVQQTSGTIQNGTVTLNAGNYDLQGGTVSAALAGSAGANVTVGTTTLSGTTANTYAGLTTVRRRHAEPEQDGGRGCGSRQPHDVQRRGDAAGGEPDQ